MSRQTVLEMSRRQLLRTAACGFGSVALQGMVSNLANAASQPLGRHVPDHFPRAKRVIFLFMAGGTVAA